MQGHHIVTRGSESVVHKGEDNSDSDWKTSR
jgi:hypothetical protein